MKRVTREVILDLMPLYLAGEVSADTRALVEDYLESDAELAALAHESAAFKLPPDVPTPLTQEDRMKTFLQVKRLMLLRTISLAVIISIAVLSLLSLALLAARIFAV
jgi:hypothetical protein